MFRGQACLEWGTCRQGKTVPRILVADDNTNIQKMVVLAFQERGVEVIAVGNGEAAVRRLPDANPDLVLADVFMPVRNGYEVCEFVKKDERFAHVPVILLVGAFDPLDEKEARRVGADGVLKKPFVPPDPLIAMVTSALEKNPRVAAEMAKAREAKEVLPEPAPVMEVPTRAEPKPLPDFPEPTPEEAALVYGFGKGVRALDDEPAEAVAGPKPPVAEKEEETDDEFDGAATSSDWRRNAMDFEVPAESANKPAFAEENLPPTDFPSEAEYPPRRVRAPEVVEESEPVAQDAAPTPVVEAPAVVEEPAAILSSQESSSAPTDKPAHAPSLWAKIWGKTQPEPTPEPALETLHTPAADYESKPEPSEPPVSAHWMDALAPNQINATGGDWLDKLSAPSASSISASYPTEEPVESREQISAFDEPIEARPEPEVHSSVEESAPQDQFPVSHAAHEDQPVPESTAPVAQESEAAENWFAPTPSVFDHVPDPVSETVPVGHSEPDRALELDADDSNAPVGLRDPGLVESPAVHVTPEPLLVDNDESHGPSEYNSRPQEIPALHSYFAPASGDPVVEEPVAAEPSVTAREEMQVPSFDPPAVEESHEDASERIPTGPPPNREALASIPFLTPPPDFRASTPEPAASNQGTVDEVVRRVLERLEPQIHDLLSQGVLKPLVENLLQSELAKKDK
jgi:CheY-like chemotaxis protein